jgi:hypothetical protein
MGGSVGLLTITLCPSPQPDTESASNICLEAEWVEITKPLMSHPMFNATDPNSVHPNAGKYVLNDTDRDTIANWQDPPGNGTATTRAAIYSAASANAQAYIKRLQKGTDSYVIYAPVIRQTTKNQNAPTISNCGEISTPPQGFLQEIGIGVNTNPDTTSVYDDYVFLQTADRATRDRYWSEVEEWTGADSVDDEIYPTQGN